MYLLSKFVLFQEMVSRSPSFHSLELLPQGDGDLPLPTTIEEEDPGSPGVGVHLYQHQDSMVVNDLNVDIDPLGLEHQPVLE